MTRIKWQNGRSSGLIPCLTCATRGCQLYRGAFSSIGGLSISTDLSCIDMFTATCGNAKKTSCTDAARKVEVHLLH